MPSPRRLAHRLLLAGLAAGAASAGVVPGAVAAPVELAWEDCGDGFECTYAEVPRDHARPRGATIELALIRKPATDPERRIGSLFMNPGGPGGSGTSFLRAAAEAFTPLNDRFDLVAFDPRGVGASRPAVDCLTDAEQEAESAEPIPVPHEIDPADLRADADLYAQRCVSRNPGILPYLSTANVARDLDLLREAVGDDNLSYLGYSYGTAIGATYATLFPGKARVLALDGAYDLDTYFNRPLESALRYAGAFEKALSRFFTACAAHQDVCGFGGDDPELAYDQLVARLNVDPIGAIGRGDPRPVTGDTVILASILPMFVKQLWPVLGAGLAEAEAGDGSILQGLADAAIGRDDEGHFDPFGDQFSVIYGPEANWPNRLTPYLEQGEDAYVAFPHFHFFAGAGNFSLARLDASVRSVGIFRGPFRNPASAAPALVISTTYDPATPYREALTFVREFGNARLLTMVGDGHTASFGGNSPCIDAAVEAYLEDRVLPPEGTSCRQEVPFAAPEPEPEQRRSADDAEQLLRRAQETMRPVVIAGR